MVSLNDDLIYVRGREAIYLGHSPFSHTQSLRLNYLLAQWVLWIELESLINGHQSNESLELWEKKEHN